MHSQLTPEQIDAFTADLAEQIRLAERAQRERPISRGSDADLLPPTQRKRLEEASGEPAETFLARFKAAARQDLCEPGGMLYRQWEQARAIDQRTLVAYSAGILTSMGLEPRGLAAALVVPLALWLFLALANLGLKALCAE
jgi:hypothetical protein